MTAVLAPMAVPAVKAWAEVLAEAIRPEFAVTVYWPAEDDRVCRLGRLEADCRSHACGRGCAACIEAVAGRGNPGS